MENFLLSLLFAPLKKGKMYLLFAIFLLSVSAYGQSQQIRLTQTKITVLKIVQEIEKQTNMSVDYEQHTLDPNAVIKVHSKKLSLSSLLDKLTENKGLQYRIVGRHIMITQKVQREPSDANSDTRKPSLRKNISGKITDAETGEPIIGANIRVTGTTMGTVSDVEGNFKLSVPAGAKLEVSYIGYRNQNVSVADGNNFRIKMQNDAQDLSEVVVVGYGTMKKSDL